MYLRKKVAAKLSPRQLEMLERHVDGPAQIVLGGPNRVTMDGLVRRKMLSYCSAKGHGVTFHQFPRFAKLTDYGREVLACALALQADRLTALGCAAPDARPITIAPDQRGEDHAEVSGHGEGICGVAADA